MADLQCKPNVHFQYPTLEPSRREIRLLALDSIDCSGTFHCSLHAAAINDNPDYIALSYVWGAPSTVKNHIFVNGANFTLQPNLFDFFTTIPASNLLGSKMFIDAICVNQLDSDELDNQIRLMRDVYRNARKVIAWQGAWDSEEDPDDDDVLATDFWSRLWIVQELILAKDLVVQIGDTTMSPETLYDLDDIPLYKQAFELTKNSHHMEELASYMRLDSIDFGSLLRSLDGMSDTEWKGFRSASRACIILTERSRLREQLLRNEYPPLHETISRFGSLISSKRQDKIFGLLGLSRSCIRVDSRVPTIELYLQVLIEGLYELAAIVQQQSANSAMEKTAEYDRAIAQFHLACMGALGLGNDAAVCLTTYRAMQHCGIIPLRSNLLFGTQRILTNICFYDGSIPFHFANRPRLLILRNFFYWAYSWFIAVVYCLLLQSYRKNKMALALSFGSPDEIRLSFQQWVAVADKVADQIDQTAEHKRPISRVLVGPESEWRTKRITGIIGGGYALDILMCPFWPAVILWKSWLWFKRKISWLRNVTVTSRYVYL